MILHLHVVKPLDLCKLGITHTLPEDTLNGNNKQLRDGKVNAAHQEPTKITNRRICPVILSVWNETIIYLWVEN